MGVHLIHSMGAAQSRMQNVTRDGQGRKGGKGSRVEVLLVWFSGIRKRHRGISSQNPTAPSPPPSAYAQMKLSSSLPCLISVLWLRNWGCDSKEMEASWVSNPEMIYFETIPDVFTSQRGSHFTSVATANILEVLFKFFICSVTLGEKILSFLKRSKNLPVASSQKNPQSSHHCRSWLQLQQQRRLQVETSDKVATTWWQRPASNRVLNVLTTSVTRGHENLACNSTHTQKVLLVRPVFSEPAAATVVSVCDILLLYDSLAKWTGSGWG